MNDYQLISLQQQNKVTALLFENLPYTLLIFIIKLQILYCHELSQGKSANAVNISLVMTMVSIVVVVINSWIESRTLKESTLGYLMTKMTANNKWIPFMHLINRRDCTTNIHFGQL